MNYFDEEDNIVESVNKLLKVGLLKVIYNKVSMTRNDNLIV